jgi:hypothetical protein
MIIYIDAEFKCHVENDGTMTPVETDFFDGMSAEYIEGFRYIPEGHIWVRDDGIEFVGEMIAPHKDYVELLGKQLAYEQEQRKDMQTALEIMGVTV